MANSGAFDAFLYVPASPPVTPSPTKRPPRSLPLDKSPKWPVTSPVLLPSPTSLQTRKRASRTLESTPIRRESPRLRTARSKTSSSEPKDPESASIEPDFVPSPTMKKRKRKGARPFADPSLYAHLPQHLSDVIAEDLTLLLIGLNPGVMTATTGYHFANPTNLFWPLLHSSRIIHEPLKAADSHVLPARYDVGITNIVGRPTAEGGELSKAECVEGCVRTIEVIRRYRPCAVTCLGKGIWDAMFQAIHGRSLKKGDNFKFGWQEEVIESHGESDTWKCRIFVTMGTSGRVAAYSPAYKRELFAELGDWVNQKRDEKRRLSEKLQNEIELDVKTEVAPAEVFADEICDTQSGVKQEQE